MHQAESSRTVREIHPVSEVTRRIKLLLEERLDGLWVEGEVSNLRRPASGHLYFTLKDEWAQIRAVFFRGHQRRASVVVRDGLRVRVFGGVTLYEKSGDCQINVTALESAGSGTLQERFERLKRKLAEEGLFDASRKKTPPLLVRHVGVVTSPTGAAIRDILHVLERRFPNIHLVITPVRVQGEGAAEEIAEGIRRLNRLGGLDVMVVTRGGGSLEDLWCFNEECVARAIAASELPVISAVGHEIDFTISDFVADIRAPTPSAAAELLVGRKVDFERHLQQQRRRMERAMVQAVQRAGERLAGLRARAPLRNPQALLRERRQDTDRLRMMLSQQVGARLGKERRRMDLLMRSAALQRPAQRLPVLLHRVRDARRRLRGSLHLARQRAEGQLERDRVNLFHAAEGYAVRSKNRLDQLVLRLRGVNPEEVLKRGYTMTCSEDGRIITTCRQGLEAGVLMTHWQDGTLRSAVLPQNQE